uniref:Uncharacterized protein n=1 Tax=viral metagenome TaxID=1070528 RepID=A0A6C0IA40_9ZZZZ
MSCRLLRTQQCTIPDKPNNPSLAKDNDSKLQNMLAERAKQDAMLTSSIPLSVVKQPVDKK